MRRVFLLGGYDLEMIEIRKILEEKDEFFVDRKLSWGATLSSYKDILNETDEFISIELEEDIKPPKNYKLIDHHGKNSHKNSSIEQIAALLNIKLNRWQKLVSANDSGYINGMKKLDATESEIEKIRNADRQAQEIDEFDEKLAQKSIRESNNKNIIKSQTHHFSAVSDRVSSKFTQYIIYNDKKVVFYGYKIEKLIDFLNLHKIAENNYYYGGGDFGFLGIKDELLKESEIEKLIKDFIQMSKDREIISYHSFMLPFTYDGTFDKRENWKKILFTCKSPKEYNEYIYFYKHVQDALYNFEEDETNKISAYYEYEQQNGSYIIKCKKGEYKLEVDGISLRIFNTKIAILTFNLINRKYSQKEDILAINDFGRRIYPQFLGEDYIKDTKKAILAESISLILDDKDPIKENFNSFYSLKNIEQKLLPKFISKLIEENFITQKLKPIIDDRMFVISQYNSDVIVQRLKQYDKSKESYYTYENDDFWYQYIFIDGDEKNCQSRHMTKKLISESSYDRWIEKGTLFGISRYSFVAITESWFGKERLLPHMQTLYFQIFTLLLTYRASIIKFSDDIQDVTNMSDKVLMDESQKLYKRYLNFLNKLYFKEVTAQDQGIELYNQAMKVMDIPKYMDDLDKEINELHSYVSMIEEKKTSQTLNILTYIGGVLLPPSLIAGFLGMNTLGEWEFKSGEYSFFIIFISSLIIPIYMKFFKKGYHEQL